MKFKLSSVLLLALVIPVMMNYGLSPEETPYWFFGVIFGLLILNLIWPRNFLFWSIIVLALGSVMISLVMTRHRTASIYQVHDIILQQEAAIRFWRQGINPYATSYFGTPLEQWHYSATETNPALYHFVMLPWYLLFVLPFSFISGRVWGYFDGRLPLFFLFGLTLFLAWRLLRDHAEKRRLLILLLAFNPATLNYLLEGRSDFFALAFLFGGWYLLAKKQYFWAGVPLALAFATKQSIWPFFPFYLAYLWFNLEGKLTLIFKNLTSFAVVFAIIILPFFFWNPKAFLDSTIFYLSGSVANSYPISGYGWGMVLKQFRVIKDIHLYYPFMWWQLAAGLPLVFFLIRWLQKKAMVSRLIFCYGIFTFIFWYFSRYFNNSHLGYLSSIFIIAYFWPESDGEK